MSKGVDTALKSVVVSGFLATALGLPGIVSAQGAGFYAGVSAGQGRYNNGCAGLVNAGLTGSCDEKDAAWKIFGGYQFNRIFGAEAGYTKLGEAHIRGTLGSAQAVASGFEMVGVATMPVSGVGLGGELSTAAAGAAKVSSAACAATTGSAVVAMAHTINAY